MGMVFLLFSFGVQAETSVSAVADRQQMGLGDAFTIVVTVESDEDFEAQLPQLPRVNGLEEINSVVGGRQSSSSMAIINGKTQFRSQTTQQYQYVM
ncbi:MAG: BatD family protein, partial [Bdellovibrionaceae bacterium]|nr:BatD family protein [Pseudobdellovibrionaceae bacterium]